MTDDTIPIKMTYRKKEALRVGSAGYTRTWSDPSGRFGFVVHAQQPLNPAEVIEAD